MFSMYEYDTKKATMPSGRLRETRSRDAPVILNHVRIVAHVKLGRHRLLIRPAVITIGHKQSRVSVIANCDAHGLNPRSFGYKSIWTNVPDVMNTDWKALKHGLDGERRVQARQLQHRIRNVRIALIVGLKNQRKAL